MKQYNSNLPRTTGVLLHPSSLPNSPVCGSFGEPAREWLRLLAQNEVGVWQFLPLGPTDENGSPYSSPSSFSFNPWFLDVNDLIEEGFLPSSILDQLPGELNQSDDYVDFNLANVRSKLIGRFLREYWVDQDSERHERYNNWCSKQFWLNDHILFMELRNKNQGSAWWDWHSRFSIYTQGALNVFKVDFQDNLLEHSLVQWHLDRQWTRVKNLAKELGILLFGDLPFYVSRNSADVWSNTSLFSILQSGDLFSQSGVPPDYFSETGQLWGTPVYRWRKHKSTRYRWWRSRISRHLQQVDLLRVDHFRALDSYWSVAGNDLTAKEGVWLSSPGIEMLNLFRKDQSGKLPLVAEDLGLITSKVEYLRDHFRLPGMKILQFAFDGNAENPYLPENIKGNQWVVYTGTHDNDTTSSWWNDLDEQIKQTISTRFLNKDLSPCWEFIEMGLSTDARLFVAPLQDLLCLGSDARFNKPGTIDNNWSWRLKSFDLNLNKALSFYSQKAKSLGRKKEDALKLI